MARAGQAGSRHGGLIDDAVNRMGYWDALLDIKGQEKQIHPIGLRIGGRDAQSTSATTAKCLDDDLKRWFETYTSIIQHYNLMLRVWCAYPFSIFF
jgi:hypothetical protein